MIQRSPAGAAAALGVATVLAVVAGCTLLAPSTSPATATPGPNGPPVASGPPILGFDWGRVTSVERPANFDATVAPSYPGVHPILRIAGQATISDVDHHRDGYVAIGYTPPSWQPVAWTSADASSWKIASMGSGEFTFPIALGRRPDGTTIAVGRSGKVPVAWTTTDGVAWDQHPVRILGTDGVAERMTTVVGVGPGFVAGGSVGPELAERRARFWTSTDGIAWDPVPDDPGFADAEVRSITKFDGGYVAVGVVGTAQAWSAAVAWTSRDGRQWTRVDDPDFVDGIAVSVIETPSGGLVAVGCDVGRRNAVAWISEDGIAWTRAPDEVSRQHPGGYAWLTDVTAVGGELIAVGDIQGLQRGTAMAWISSDGLRWSRSNRAPVQEGAEFYAITSTGSGAIAVGAFGAPDSYVPEVWSTPAR